MLEESIGKEVYIGYQVSLYKVNLADGRYRFSAETQTENGDMFLIDHWNLALLQKTIKEIVEVIVLLKKWQIAS